MEKKHTPIHLTECSRDEILGMFLQVLQIVSAARLLVSYARRREATPEGIRYRLEALGTVCDRHDWVLDLC